MTSRVERLAPHCLSLLRIAAALLFMQHGSQKLFAVPAMGGAEPVNLITISGLGGILEFFGGLLVLLGIYVRSVSFLLSGMMAYAYFAYHAEGNLSPLLNRGELAILYSFVFLYLAAAGGGPWTIRSMMVIAV